MTHCLGESGPVHRDEWHLTQSSLVLNSFPFCRSFHPFHSMSMNGFWEWKKLAFLAHFPSAYYCSACYWSDEDVIFYDSFHCAAKWSEHTARPTNLKTFSSYVESIARSKVFLLRQYFSTSLFAHFSLVRVLFELRVPTSLRTKTAVQTPTVLERSTI